MWEKTGAFILNLWHWIEQNSSTLQAVSTVFAALVGVFYLWATVKLWRESKVGNMLAQLRFSPQVMVTTESPTSWGYMLAFNNESPTTVFVQCDVFLYFMGQPKGQPAEISKKAIKQLEFSLASGGKKQIPIDTFWDLKKRGLGEYTPHTLRVEGKTIVKATGRLRTPISTEIKERFQCIMRNQVPKGKMITAESWLDPSAWEWRWLIFNLSEKHVGSDKIDPWPEEELPEEFRPSNNNKGVYKRKVLKVSSPFDKDDSNGREKGR